MSVKRYSVNLSVNRSVEVTESLCGSLVEYVSDLRERAAAGKGEAS